MPVRRWYLAMGNRRLGPYDADQIPELIRDGTLQRETYVWHEDLEGWTTAGEVAELAMQFKSPPKVSSAPPGAEANAPADADSSRPIVSRDVVSRLVDRVTAEVAGEVMGRLSDYTRDVNVPSAKPEPAGAGAAGAARTSRPGASPEAARKKGSAEAHKAEPSRPPATVPGPRPPSAPAATTRIPVTAEPSRAAMTGTVAAARPAGSDPYDIVSALVRTGAASSHPVPIGIVRTMATLIKAGGGVGLLVGLLMVGRAIADATGGPANVIIRIGWGLIPLVISLCIVAFGYLIDLWLAQSEQVRAILESARKPGGAGPW